MAQPSVLIIEDEEGVRTALARRLAEWFEWHYTPKHGSWLDMAEIELGILGRQCLARRIDNVQDLRREIKAWEKARNDGGMKVNRQYTTEDARSRLKRLYPSIEQRQSTGRAAQCRAPYAYARLAHRPTTRTFE